MGRKILTSLPLINTANLELHVEQFPLKKIGKLAKRLLHRKG